MRRCYDVYLRMRNVGKRVTMASFLQHWRHDMGIEVGGLFGFIVLVLNVWAIVRTVQSKASTGSKVLWIILILLLPVVGFILWLLLGPKS
jgi:hypothetical protein